jgi:hypothetical protein
MPKVRRQRRMRPGGAAPRDAYDKERRMRAALNGLKNGHYKLIRSAARSNKVS